MDKRAYKNNTHSIMRDLLVLFIDFQMKKYYNLTIRGVVGDDWGT